MKVLLQSGETAFFVYHTTVFCNSVGQFLDGYGENNVWKWGKQEETLEGTSSAEHQSSKRSVGWIMLDPEFISLSQNQGMNVRNKSWQ